MARTDEAESRLRSARAGVNLWREPGLPSAGVVVRLPGQASRLPFPFTLGVASGDPTPGGVVLWTRLAPDLGQPAAAPLTLPYAVRWEVAADDRFRRIVARGASVASPADAHSVHAEVTGLVPGGVYWYRFFCAEHCSEVGTTRVAPARGGAQEGVRWTLARASSLRTSSCDAMARDDLDFCVLQHGEPERTIGSYGTLAQQRLAWRDALSPSLRTLRRVLPVVAACDSPMSPATLRALWEHAPLRRARFRALTRLSAAPPLVFGDLLALYPSRGTEGADTAWRVFVEGGGQEPGVIERAERQGLCTRTRRARTLSLAAPAQGYARWEFRRREVYTDLFEPT